MIVGVYAITNLATGKVYIGSSRDTSKRIGVHLRSLRDGKHPYKPLQEDWNQVGEESFSFDVIEEAIESELPARELDWLRTCRGRSAGVYNVTDRTNRATISNFPVPGETALRSHRRAKLLSQAELAKLAGISTTTVCLLESGLQQARISTVRKLATALDIDPATILVKKEDLQ